MKENKISNILDRISHDKGSYYTLSYGPGYWSEVHRQICIEFLDMNIDVNDTSSITNLISLDDVKKEKLIEEICEALKGVKRDHLLVTFLGYHIDNDDIFFNKRGTNLRWFIIVLDNFIGDRNKFRSFIKESLADNFLQRMENHVKNIQLKTGVKQRDLHKIKFYDTKLEFNEK